MPETRDPDAKLVERAKQGDSAAFAALYEKHMAKVYSFCYAKVASREDAQDVTQATFSKMLTSLGGFSGSSTFKTWLYGIAKHAVMDYYRERYRNKDVPLEDFVHMLEQPGEGEGGDPKKEKQVEKILGKMDGRQRGVLELRFLKSYTIKETAAELQLSESNVKVIQHRALKRAAQQNEL